MGYYINNLPSGKEISGKTKVQDLLSIPGAEVIQEPKRWQENLVCVIHNFLFDAAGYIYSEEELTAFSIIDGRKKTWMLVPGASKLSGYHE